MVSGHFFSRIHDLKHSECVILNENNKNDTPGLSRYPGRRHWWPREKLISVHGISNAVVGYGHASLTQRYFDCSNSIALALESLGMGPQLNIKIVSVGIL